MRNRDPPHCRDGLPARSTGNMWSCSDIRLVQTIPDVYNQRPPGAKESILDIRYLYPPYERRHRLTGPGTGHLWWWLLEESKVVEKSLLEEYGAIARWNGSLGVGFHYGAGLAVLSSHCLRRRSACGLPTPRPFTMSSRVLVTCTINRPLSGNRSR